MIICGGIPEYNYILQLLIYSYITIIAVIDIISIFKTLILTQV